jgi:hypothetical protein
VDYAPPASENSFYPRSVDIRYPKPGSPNPIASVWVYVTPAEQYDTLFCKY